MNFLVIGLKNQRNQNLEYIVNNLFYDDIDFYEYYFLRENRSYLNFLNFYDENYVLLQNFYLYNLNFNFIYILNIIGGLKQYQNYFYVVNGINNRYNFEEFVNYLDI